MAYKREHVKERFRPKPGKLLDQVREVMRYHHYAIRTEQTYVKWILDYIRFNGTRHPEMGIFSVRVKSRLDPNTYCDKKQMYWRMMYGYLYLMDSY